MARVSGARIIRGRWEISDYRFNLDPAPVIFTGPEITIAPPYVLAQHKWTGRILDSLPAEVRAISEPDIQRVQEEARALVRAQALATANTRRFPPARSATSLDSIASKAWASAAACKSSWPRVERDAHARYGLDDTQAKGSAELASLSPDGSAVRLFASRDFRNLGDVEERSSVVNSLAARNSGATTRIPISFARSDCGATSRRFADSIGV